MGTGCSWMLCNIPPLSLEKGLCASSISHTDHIHCYELEAPILFFFLLCFYLQVDSSVVVKMCVCLDSSGFVEVLLCRSTTLYLTFLSKFKFYSKIYVSRKPIILWAKLLLSVLPRIIRYSFNASGIFTFNSNFCAFL